MVFQTSQVSVVIPVYHPKSSLFPLLHRLQKQCARTYLVENSPLPQAERHSLEASFSSDWLEFLPTERNLGTAGAFNLGAQKAIEKNSLYLWLFDQDSVPLSFCLEAMNHIFTKDFSGAVYHARHGEPGESLPATLSVCPKDFREVPVAISSGSLIPLAVWKHLGGFEADFFVDQVDHEFCLRARSKGYRIQETQAPLFSHSIGEREKKTFLGRDFYPLNYPPHRWQGNLKNLMVLTKRYLKTERSWLAQEWIALIKRSAKALFFEKQKLSKAFAMVRGIIAGLVAPSKKRKELP